MSDEAHHWTMDRRAVLMRHFRRMGDRLRRYARKHVVFWALALIIGIVSGFVAILFRFGIAWLQAGVYGVDQAGLLDGNSVPWYVLMGVPILGGLIVGLILHYFTPDGRVRSVADVIDGAAMNNGRVETKEGIASAFASLITLAMGGSTGREGPVVHLASTISTWVLNRMKADGITGRDLMGCAVAAAVAASFNAPMAGALFALEVILRHFAIHAFAPIVVAAVSGAVINQLNLGGGTEFVLPDAAGLEFHGELPAFLILGVVCGLVAVAMMKSLFLAEDIGNRIQHAFHVPRWVRPVVAGVLLGILALWFPFIIGVGYQTTNHALTGSLGLQTALVYALIKVLALAITYGGRMGGGVFSPGMMVGALTGVVFGAVATHFYPDASGEVRYYALAGFGGVAAAVLGAPISTTLIVFEMTGDWGMALAVMMTVSISTAISTKLVKRSFFLTQLERRGLKIAAGPHEYLARLVRVGDLVRVPEEPRAVPSETAQSLIAAGDYLNFEDDLQKALGIFERNPQRFLPVVRIARGEDRPKMIGVLYHVDALKAHNYALVAASAEEHS